MFKDLMESFWQLLFPSKCPSCNAYTEKEGSWCQACLAELITMDNLEYKQDVRQVISPIFAMGKYKQGLQRIIHELKYQGKIDRVKFLAPFFAILEDELDLTYFDIIIPVPLHQDKLAKRGYNQVDVIFADYCGKQGLNYAPILIRTRWTKSQYQLNYQQRQDNLNQAFQLEKGVQVQGLKCLLVDDIFTTGSTLRHCAEILLAQGAASVSGLVLASNANE